MRPALTLAVAALLWFTQASFAQQVQMARPGRGEGPTRVEISVVVVEILEIDDAEETLDIDFVLEARWNDPRLSWNTADDPEASVLRYRLDEAWNPRLRVVNAKALDARLPEALDVSPGGTVTYTQRLLATLTTTLELREFPMDHQRLPIRVVTGNYSPDEVDLVVDRERLALVETAPAGWKLALGEPEVGVLNLSRGEREMAQVTFFIEAARESAYFVWTMVVPLILIVFMAWMVFWIDPSLMSPQVGISTAAVFSMIAYRTALRVTLPKVTYLTRADVFILGCTLILFIALGQAVAGGRLAMTGREALARRMDRLGRWLYAVFFALVIVIALRW